MSVKLYLDWISRKWNYIKNIKCVNRKPSVPTLSPWINFISTRFRINEIFDVNELRWTTDIMMLARRFLKLKESLNTLA